MSYQIRESLAACRQFASSIVADLVRLVRVASVTGTDAESEQQHAMAKAFESVLRFADRETGVPTPRPAGDALVIDLPTSTGRSLAEYAPATKAVSS